MIIINKKAEITEICRSTLRIVSTGEHESVIHKNCFFLSNCSYSRVRSLCMYSGVKGKGSQLGLFMDINDNNDKME